MPQNKIMNAPLFSVVIPTYNRSALIAATLRSIDAQTFRDFETIVVDDGSTDDTCSIVEQFTHVRLLRQANAGPGAARNLGVSAASGRIIAFLDSDDLWFPWTLETYATVVQRYPKVRFIAGCPCQFENEDEVPSVMQGALQCTEFADYCASFAQWSWFGVSSFVIERKAFLSAGGFRVGRVNGEDAELALRMANVSTFVQITGPQTFAYRSHPGNITKDLERATECVFDLIAGERSSRFPGGISRAGQRRRIITRHVRPVCFQLARAGHCKQAWRLFTQTWLWHVAQRRLRFMLAFPIVLLRCFFKSSGTLA